jgi:hypothetical protein
MLPPATGVHHMPEESIYAVSAFVPLVDVYCSGCRGRMTLTQTRRPIPRYDLHLFECEPCGYAHVMSLEDGGEPGPMKWVLSAVKPSR